MGYINMLAERCHRQAVISGFWEEEERNQAEMIALVHSELSELLEALRDDNPISEKIAPFTEAEEEVADVIIRLLDMSHAAGWDIDGAIMAKLNFNAARAYKHGRSF